MACHGNVKGGEGFGDILRATSFTKAGGAGVLEKDKLFSSSLFCDVPNLSFLSFSVLSSLLEA